MHIPLTSDHHTYFRENGASFGKMVTVLDERAAFELPCVFAAKVAPSMLVEVGAFPYTQGDMINLATIGRYCSLAEEVSLGGAAHPTDWLSTEPFQYRADPHGWNNYALSRGYTSALPHTVLSFAPGAKMVVGHDVWIRRGATILGGVTIGDGAIMGAGAVVTKDVSPCAIVGASRPT